LRDPDASACRAAQVGPGVEQFVRVLLRGMFPWARLRQAQKLLRPADRYGAARVNVACTRAHGFELLDVYRVEAILRAPLERQTAAGERGMVVVLPSPLRPGPRGLCPSYTSRGGVPCPGGRPSSAPSSQEPALGLPHAHAPGSGRACGAGQARAPE